ncbi:hypothetical protein JG688_00015699 [Phytophthora aleatoria]|uniref:Uncharacterized protein n=1 Tax=Phytophthora aleatoria TaxID=2496075 RepID=A0A8J5MD98_9STRA|nr:hypothetical protein JG688_00015699 [Phytophthora aleatoria]
MSTVARSGILYLDPLNSSAKNASFPWKGEEVNDIVHDDSEVGGMTMEYLEYWAYSKLVGVGFDYIYAELYRLRSGC